MATIKRPPVFKAILMQILVLAILVGLFWLFATPEVSQAILLGGLSAIVPNAYFVWRAFRYMGAINTKRIISSFYQGEAGKFLLTATFLAVVFTWVPEVEPLPLFLSMIVFQVLHLVLAAKLLHQTTPKKGG